MVRLRVTSYCKRYMRKNLYHYKRYYLTVPKAIGEKLDTSVEYAVHLFGPAIVYLPKGLENFFSRLEKLERLDRENIAGDKEPLTESVQENIRTVRERD